MSLKEYDKKRDFTKTKEPKGSKKKKSDSDLIFVVQKHDATRLHYDFRLEWDGVLLSWAVPKGPSYNTKDKRLAVEVEPHPYDYKDFEGTIPKGQYGGGSVMLWDEGTWNPQENHDFEKGLKDGSIKIEIHGERLKGKWALVRMKKNPSDKQTNWLLIKEKDEYAQDNDGISDFDTSVRSGKTMDNIASGEEIKDYSVQLATLKSSLPKGDNWIYELKYDGYRILAYVDNGNVRLMTRNDQDYTHHFPSIKKSLEKIKDKVVLDGEVIVTKDGISDFQSLQKYIKDKKGPKPVYMAFDLLYYGGKDITDEPLKERRSSLKELLDNHELKEINFSTDVKGNPQELLDTICISKMEGLICKKEDKPYIPGRNNDWLKVKCENRQEFIIVGYTQTESRTRAFSALILGLVEDGKIIHAGRVGTGFSEKSAKEIMKKMKPLERKTSPLENPPKKRYNESLTWVRPDLVAEVSFSQWTDEGLLRQPSFKGIRLDKDFKEVENEEKRDVQKTKENKESTDEEKVEKKQKSGVVVKKKPKKKKDENEVVLSSPEKEIFNDYTKKDLYEYYIKIFDKIRPYIERRFLSLVRCPNGISKECFYQKNTDENFKFLQSDKVELKKGDVSDYLYIDDIEGIKEAVQYSTIEFHIWGSKIDNIEKPDMLVFDLDPDEGMDIEKVREGCRDLKEILDKLNLKSYLKTSGNKGYHIVVPLVPNASFEECREFTKNVAIAMEQTWPKKYTSNMRKEKRKGKIYVDWVRNTRGATSVAPYSVRAKEPGAVSMPISWDDLDKVEPKDYTMEKVLKNRKKDPWADFFKTDQKINKG